MKLLKNPVFWGLVLLAGGMIVGAIGWIKEDSTVIADTKGSVFMMVTGGAMIVAGLIIWAVISQRKK